MDHIAALAGLSGVFLLACMGPGPSFVLISSTAVVAHRRPAMFVGLGVAAATLTWASAAALGLSLIFAEAPRLYSVIKLLGALYIVRIGLQMLLTAWRTRGVRGQITVPALGLLGHFGRGYLVAVSNPFAMVFVGSVYSAMLPPTTPPLVYACAALLITIVSACWHCGIAAVFSARRIQTEYRRHEKIINTSVGSLMISLGARLLIL